MSTVTVGLNNSVPATSTLNVALGTLIEFVGAPSVLSLWMTADSIATPTTPLTAQLLVNIGAAQIVPIAAGSSINAAAVAGKGPVLDEDQLAASIPIPAGARVQLNVSNPTAGAVQVRWRATLTS